MATLTDLFAVYDIAGAVYFRIDSSGNLYGSAGDILGGSGVDFGSTSSEGGNVYLADSKVVGLGADQDLTVTHNGTNSVITSNTGDLIIDNVLATGSTLLDLGTDTSATDVQIRNNSGTALLTVKGDAAISTAASTMDLDASGAVQINSSAGAISIGNDAVAQAVNIATGAAARAIAIGNAASASLAMDGGIGGVTVDADTSIALQQRTTTTDGVAAGIAKVVGGLAYSQVAASAAVTNSKAEVDFDKVIELPIDTLKAGTTLKIRTQGIATATNGTDTLTIKVYLGTAVLLTTAAIDVTDGDVWFADLEVIVRTVGTGGTLVASASYQDPDAAGTAPKWAYLGSTAIDTTAANTVKASATWSAASTANSCRQDMLSVVVY